MNYRKTPKVVDSHQPLFAFVMTTFIASLFYTISDGYLSEW